MPWCQSVVHLSVRLSVTEVHWRIIANLGFKFWSHFTHRPPCCCGRRAAGGRRAMLAGESSRAMLASARVSCYLLHFQFQFLADHHDYASSAITFGRHCYYLPRSRSRLSAWVTESCLTTASAMYIARWVELVHVVFYMDLTLLTCLIVPW